MIGPWLRAERERRGYTAEDMRRTGYDIGTWKLSQWERNLDRPTRAECRHIASALEDLHYLRTGQKEKVDVGKLLVMSGHIPDGLEPLVLQAQAANSPIPGRAPAGTLRLTLAFDRALGLPEEERLALAELVTGFCDASQALAKDSASAASAAASCG